MDQAAKLPTQGLDDARSMKQYQGYSVSSVPLDGPSGLVRQPVQRRPEEEDSDIEEADLELANILSKPPAAPVPSQYDRFIRQLRIGCFVSTIEVLMDSGSEDIEQIRTNAALKADELIRSTGEDPSKDKKLIGFAKQRRDMKRMSFHIEYLNGLCVKFVDDFDGTPERVKKLRRATGYIKGVLARDGQKVFNITDKSVIDSFGDMLDIFKVNSVLFIEYISSWKNK